MNLRLNVSVTQRHIDEGRRADYNNCPVARAIVDAFEDAFDFMNPRSLGCRSEVGYSEAYVKANFPGLETWYLRGRLPDTACIFITQFDLKKPVVPFSFPLTLEYR